MRRLLIPIDATPATGAALRHCSERLAPEGPLLAFLVAVREPVVAWHLRGFRLPHEIARFQTARWEALLEQAAAQLRQAGVDCVCEIRAGRRAPAIAQAAAEHECSDILLGVEGMTLLNRLLFPSIAHRLMRVSAVPVTIVACGLRRGPVAHPGPLAAHGTPSPLL